MPDQLYLKVHDLSEITAGQEVLLRADPERSAFQPSVLPGRSHYLL